MRIKTDAYWATTIPIALETFFGGLTDLVHGRAMLVAGPSVAGMVMHLGYPLYVLRIIGVWKLLGAIALLVPGFQRLKEWAYAGIFFELTGAAASWLAHGDKMSELVAPLILASLTLASWALRPRDRMLGVLFAKQRE